LIIFANKTLKEVSKMNNYVFVTRSFLPPMEEYINEIKELWDTHWITNMRTKPSFVVGINLISPSQNLLGASIS